MKKILFAIPVLILFFFAFIFKRTVSVSSSNETLLDILKKRYAKGEITVNEYEDMKKKLV
jgi:putative membrane protein